MGEVKDTLKGLVERFPALQWPAYLLYNGSSTFKNVAARFAVNRFGYLPSKLSDRGQDAWVIDEVFQGRACLTQRLIEVAPDPAQRIKVLGGFGHHFSGTPLNPAATRHPAA